jgi:hypothetical protein
MMHACACREIGFGSIVAKAEVTMSTHRLSGIAMFTLLAACASSPQRPPQPLDMSAAKHEEMARKNEQTAKEHLAQYDPEARSDGPCVPMAAKFAGPCWTAHRNATREHLDIANHHKKLAAQHRAASQALREAEGRACAGVSEEDRDESPFEETEDILAVDVTGDAVLVTFRAVQNLTGAWLQRDIDCHLARNAAMGFEDDDMKSCPLNIKGVTATVKPVIGGFLVTMKASNAASFGELVKRARAIKPR